MLRYTSVTCQPMPEASFKRIFSIFSRNQNLLTHTHTHTHTHTQAMKTKAPKTSWLRSSVVWGLSSRLYGKESACSAGDSGSIPGSGRSPGEGNGNPLQYFCLGKSHGQRSLVGYSPWCHRVGHDRVSTPLKDSHQGSG